MVRESCELQVFVFVSRLHEATCDMRILGNGPGWKSTLDRDYHFQELQDSHVGLRVPRFQVQQQHSHEFDLYVDSFGIVRCTCNRVPQTQETTMTGTPSGSLFQLGWTRIDGVCPMVVFCR